jgi:hypothetical protein
VSITPLGPPAVVRFRVLQRTEPLLGPALPKGRVMCEHGFHPFPDLDRLASLDILWAGSAGLQGRHRTAGPPGQRTDEADTYGWTSRPRALEPAVGVMNRLPHAQGPGQDRWSLHIAGLNNMGCAIRLHRMGQAGQAGLEQVEGRDYRGPSLCGPGSRCAVMGIVPFRLVTSHNPSELYTDPQPSFLRSGGIWYRAILRHDPLIHESP